MWDVTITYMLYIHLIMNVGVAYELPFIIMLWRDGEGVVGEKFILLTLFHRVFFFKGRLLPSEAVCRCPSSGTDSASPLLTYNFSCKQLPQNPKSVL